MKTQKQVVLKRLLAKKTVNTIDAIRGKYGNMFILRLSDIIFNLRKKGYIIDTMPVKNKTNGSSTAKYILKGKKKK